jgi:hypothetical protein
VRCGRCGNDNAEANRFCGMCGAPLAAKTQPEGQAPASPSEVEPTTGPMTFLGLSTPGPAADRDTHPPAGHDPLQPSSRNLDYLLDDEEGPKRGWGKLILIVVALALALGFGYLHWKQGGFDWLNLSAKKPAAAVPDAGQGADSAGSGTAGTQDGAAGQAGGGSSAPSTPTTATESAPPPATPPQTSSQGAPAQATPAQDALSQNPPSDPNLPAKAESQPATKVRAEPKPAARRPAAAKPFDAVTEAERYIYGRGVRQDCDHGMHVLKPAAEQSNPKALISLGTLYSTGTCVPRDLPTAYRWFALALHKQPDNQALQDDLKSLWEKMTPPERQLAIKLSQ